MREAFWRGLLDILEGQEAAMLALVAEASRHSPGTAGAAMWVSRDDQAGTIGGGAMERRWIERARGLLDRPYFAELQDLEHRAGGKNPSGLICAGRQTQALYLCRPEEAAQLHRFLKLREEDRPGHLILDAKDGLEVVPRAKPSSHVRELKRHGGSWRFRQEILERQRVAIFGAGHCGEALAEQMSRLGWKVDVWDTRPTVIEAAAERLRNLAEVHGVSDFREAGPKVNHPELTAAVVMTTDLPNDVRALEGTLPHPFPFLGVMGAKAKLAEIRHRLTREGFKNTQLSRLTAPVGLPIDSDTPAEIAVSVAAQLLQHRQDWLGKEKIEE